MSTYLYAQKGSCTIDEASGGYSTVWRLGVSSGEYLAIATTFAEVINAGDYILHTNGKTGIILNCDICPAKVTGSPTEGGGTIGGYLSVTGGTRGLGSISRTCNLFGMTIHPIYLSGGSLTVYGYCNTGVRITGSSPATLVIKSYACAGPVSHGILIENPSAVVLVEGDASGQSSGSSAIQIAAGASTAIVMVYGNAVGGGAGGSHGIAVYGASALVVVSGDAMGSATGIGCHGIYNQAASATISVNNILGGVSNAPALYVAAGCSAILVKGNILDSLESCAYSGNIRVMHGAANYHLMYDYNNKPQRYYFGSSSAFRRLRRFE